MFCFVHDGDGHWYIIEVSQRQEFEDYREAMENDGEWHGVDFNKYRSMHPVNYMFSSRETLKETE